MTSTLPYELDGILRTNVLGVDVLYQFHSNKLPTALVAYMKIVALNLLSYCYFFSNTLIHAHTHIRHSDELDVDISISGADWNSQRNAVVTVSNEENNLMYYDTNTDMYCGRHDGTLHQWYTTITCVLPVSGQYVQVQVLTGYNYIKLYEIEVHGY